MFEKAVYERPASRSLSEVGELAEILLFYGSVEIFFNSSNITYFLKTIGPDALLRLVRLPFVKSSLVSDIPCVESNRNGFVSHRFMTGSIEGRQKGKRLSKRERVIDIFRGVYGDDGLARRQAIFFSQFLDEASYSTGLAGPDLILSTMHDAVDRSYARQAARVILEDRIPSIFLPDSFKFDPLPYLDSLIVDTDLNFSAINRDYSHALSEFGELSVASVLAAMLQSNATFGVSARLGGDVFTDNSTSKLLRLKVSGSVGYNSDFQNKLGRFEELCLEGRSISDALIGGYKSFHDFLDIVEDSFKFKEWVSGIDGNEDLAKQYFKELSSISWIESLPATVMRYLFFTGAGVVAGQIFSPAVGTVSSLLLSAADTFLLERVAGGWKPNHFVRDKIKKFVV